MRCALLGLLVLLATAPAIEARSVLDREIGWSPALLRELRLPKVPAAPCRARPLTKRDTRVQSRIDEADPRDALYLILHDRPTTNLWGNLWFDACDGGRLEVGVASGGSRDQTRRAVRQARAYLTRRRLSSIVRLVAVRSTYRQLSDAVDALSDQFAAEIDGGLISPGIDTRRNTVDVDVGRATTSEQRDRLTAAALASPVNVVLHVEPAPAPTTTSPSSSTAQPSTVPGRSSRSRSLTSRAAMTARRRRHGLPAFAWSRVAAPGC